MTLRKDLRELETSERVSDLPHLAAGLFHVLCVILCIVTWYAGYRLVTVVLWFVLAWVSHAALSRLHEAVHGMLSRSKRWNEFSGIVIGTLGLTPMSVYRYMHAQHHAHLGDPNDPEFWPYNLPSASRGLRLVYSWSELLFGWLFTPFLYSMRTARAWPTLPGKLRRRLALEWVGLAVFWGGILTVVGTMGWWQALLVGHVVPAWITGSAQTVRKFTEHLGMMGSDIFSMTRTVVYRGRVGRLMSASQLFVDHHATHHRYPRIPYRNLPLATEIVYREVTSEPLFRNHFVAMWDALRHLSDPRVGPQWSRPDGVGKSSVLRGRYRIP